MSIKLIKDLESLIERKEKYFDSIEVNNDVRKKAMEIELKILYNVLTKLIDDYLENEIVVENKKNLIDELEEFIHKLGVVSWINYTHKQNMRPDEIFKTAKLMNYDPERIKKIREFFSNL